MSVLFRCRIERETLDRANCLAGENGTSTGELVRIFLTQFVKSGQCNLKLVDNNLVNREARDKMMRSLDDTDSW
jgi:antitoxin component of RelBE/YafQ-DinJ toxin-antitoxin module